MGTTRRGAGGRSAPLPPGATWARLVPVSHLPGDAAAFAGATSPPRGLVVGQWQNLSLLNNAEVLLAWKNLVGPRWQDRKPKLVIVTVSGGGIRASVWASVVLRKLEATLGADFPYHVRLVTGASGGMVAGSYYVTSLRPPTAEVLAGGQASFADLHGVSIGEFVDRMALDQLDAVAGRMLFADLPATLNPFMRQGDRGRTLEETWIRWTGGPTSPLGRSIQSYAADERLGWRPSLVFTPMMVEDGRRLLISNLDLAFATRNVGGLLLEPSSRKIERPAIQGGDFDESIHEEDEVFSLSAVEFFRLFPRAGDFQVTTAIRMSASVPLGVARLQPSHAAAPAGGGCRLLRQLRHQPLGPVALEDGTVAPGEHLGRARGAGPRQGEPGGPHGDRLRSRRRAMNSRSTGSSGTAAAGWSDRASRRSPRRWWGSPTPGSGRWRFATTSRSTFRTSCLTS